MDGPDGLGLWNPKHGEGCRNVCLNGEGAKPPPLKRLGLAIRDSESFTTRLYKIYHTCRSVKLWDPGASKWTWAFPPPDS